MAHFAHVNNGIVDSVLVIAPETLQGKGGWVCPTCNEFKDSTEWVQTSYNTQGGEYKVGATPQEKLSLKAVGAKADTDARNRKNFAGVGYTYDKKRDAFIPPQPFPSWVLNETTCLYEAPVPMPEVDLDTNKIEWDENITNWVITPRK